MLALPDGTLLASGGASRNQLFRFSPRRRAAGTPLATLPYPIYELALDANGTVIWAATGGGPLLKLDPATGADPGTLRRRRSRRAWRSTRPAA